MAKRATIEAASDIDAAYITPLVLTWALDRSSHSRETIAKKIKVALGQLSEWESKPGAFPQFKKAWDLAQALDIPFGYLFLPAPPDQSLPIPDFRKAHAGESSMEFRQLLSDLLLKRDWYRDYVRNEGEAKASFVGRFTEESDVPEVAEDVRSTLNITSRFRAAAGSWTEYLSLLSRRVDQKGILVMRTSVVRSNTKKPIRATEVQGFAVADEWAPLIFVNSGDFKAAQIFTLIHELAHIWIAVSGISNPEDGEGGSGPAEIFCNRVATEVLVPEDEFEIAWRRADRHSRISTLAREFWVSSLVIIRRAKELGHISAQEYRELRAEAIGAQTRAKGGGGSYFRTAAVRLGSRFPNAVFGEVDRGRLPLADASALMGMRVPTLLKFAESLK